MNLAMLIYRNMIEYQYKTDFSLTYREIAERLDYSTHSWLRPYIKWLKENGYAKSKGRQIRAIPQEVN
jgi:hypothetical protein